MSRRGFFAWLFGGVVLLWGKRPGIRKYKPSGKWVNYSFEYKPAIKGQWDERIMS